MLHPLRPAKMVVQLRVSTDSIGVSVADDDHLRPGVGHSITGPPAVP